MDIIVLGIVVFSAITVPVFFYTHYRQTKHIGKSLLAAVLRLIFWFIFAAFLVLLFINILFIFNPTGASTGGYGGLVVFMTLPIMLVLGLAICGLKVLMHNAFAINNKPESWKWLSIITAAFFIIMFSIDIIL